MGSVGAKTPALQDEFGGYFGARGQQSLDERIQNLVDSSDRGQNLINPHYSEGGLYRTNCALCATAVALEARGYDVEAMPRDTTKDANGRDIGWRGLDSVFDVDYSNPDNYFTSGSRYRMSGVPSKTQIVNNSYNGAYSGRINDYEVPVAPRGASAVTKAIVDKVSKAGTSVWALNVKWKGAPSAHVINVINQNGRIYGYDAQSGMKIPQSSLLQYMKRTVAQRTSLVRLDNAPLREDRKDLDKMFKRRSAGGNKGSVAEQLKRFGL